MNRPVAALLPGPFGGGVVSAGLESGRCLDLKCEIMENTISGNSSDDSDD